MAKIFFNNTWCRARARVCVCVCVCVCACVCFSQLSNGIPIKSWFGDTEDRCICVCLCLSVWFVWVGVNVCCSVTCLLSLISRRPPLLPFLSPLIPPHILTLALSLSILHLASCSLSPPPPHSLHRARALSLPLSLSLPPSFVLWDLGADAC